MVWSGCITSTLQHQATAMICGSVMISSALPKQNRSKTPFSWRHPCEQAVCTIRYPPKAPTFVTWQSLPDMHALRFFPSVSLGYGGKFFWWPVPGLVKAVRAGGVSVIGRRFRWDRRRLAPARWFPPGPGRERGGVLRTLRVVGAFPVPRGATPRCPACPAGVPISPEKWGERGPGLRPWTPGFYGRSLPLAGFWDRCLWYGRGAISSGMLRPIWDAFSEKICRKAFLRKTVPKSGHVHGHRNSPSTETMRHNRQNERVQTSGP